ncbi:MAG TPA: extracellular solute-binding protein [Anaerolineales bacterium]|nr:extracellular solute-binding protein [Anaerolineales bacterium]
MKNHQKTFVLLFFLLFVLMLSACKTEEPIETVVSPIDTNMDVVPVQLNIYTPKYLINDNISSTFNEETNVIIHQEIYSSDEELIALINKPPLEIGLIVASNYAASVLRDQNLLTVYNANNVPNIVNIDGRFRNPTYDPYNQYCAAYTYGTIGLGFINGQNIFPTSWGDLFRQAPDSPTYGRTSLLNHPREAFAAALMSLGYNPNTTSEAEIREAKQLLINSAANFSDVNSTSYWEDLALFNTTLAQGFSHDFLAGQQINSEMNYSFPSEGAILRTYNFCLPLNNTSPAQKRAAEAFVNMALDPEWALNTVFALEMPTTVMVDNGQIPLDAQQNPLIYPPDEVLKNAQYVYSIGAQEILYTTAWADVLEAIR